MTRQLTRCALGAGALLAAALVGCAWGGDPEAPTPPEAVLDIWVEFAGPVDDMAYYYVAFNAAPGWTSEYPVPVASGPYWGNGWGTGAMTHFLEYRLGRYDLYEAQYIPVLREAGGGITAVGGAPTAKRAGQFTLTVRAADQFAHGAVTVSGEGMIESVRNVSGQNAGTLTINTDEAGDVVAGSVAFTPAANGGRPLNSAEQARLAALNVGGAPLLPDSLAVLGFELTLAAPRAGSQSLVSAVTWAWVDVRFVPIVGAARSYSAALLANSSNPSTVPPIPGAVITTGDLVPGGKAEIDVEVSQSATPLGPPFESTAPSGGRYLRAAIDLRDFGTNVASISFNIISTTELIFDPSVTDPDLNTYDGLGPFGNDAVTISATEFRSYSNAYVSTDRREGPEDVTLRGRASPERRASVDITNWWASIRRLR